MGQAEPMRARSALVSKATLGDLCVFAAALWFACATWGAGLSAVTGAVRNSITGLPVGNAVVRLVPTNPERPGYLATTGADGIFRFENVQPADYQVIVERHGFTRDSEIVRLMADKETQLKLDATPLASIAGKVLDADGEPVPNASVRVIRAEWIHGKRAYFPSASADANERGEFRIAELQPGRYRLVAIPPVGPMTFSISEGPGTPESRLAPAYYPTGLNLDGAAAVDLEAGQELTGIQFKLSMMAAFHVRGSAGAGWKSWLQFPIVQAVRMDNGGPADWFAFTGGIKADGAFDIAGLPAGVYAIAAVPPFAAEPQSAPVTVTTHDVNGVVISKPVAASLRVSLLYPPDTADKPGDRTFRLEQAQPSGWRAPFSRGSQAQLRADGSLAFEKVTPGTYQPVFIGDDHWYVQSMTYNGQPVTSAAIEVANGSESELGVTLAKANASVDCKVSASGKSWVVAVTTDAGPGNMRVRPIMAKSDGRIALHNLPPGHYLIFAIEKYGDWPWENEDFINALRGQAAAVELGDEGSAHVELKLVSQETLKRAEEGIP